VTTQQETLTGQDSTEHTFIIDGKTYTDVHLSERSFEALVDMASGNGSAKLAALLAPVFPASAHVVKYQRGRCRYAHPGTPCTCACGGAEHGEVYNRR
jgi:hypothetical protein